MKPKYTPPQAFCFCAPTATGQYRPECKCQYGHGESSSGECRNGNMPTFGKCTYGGHPVPECLAGGSIRGF
jgi:hypothetical protein